MLFSTVVLSLSAISVVAAADPDLMTLLKDTDSLSTLTSLVSKDSGLARALGTAKNITILAPTNDAFQKMMNADGYTEPSSQALNALLGYHVLNGTYASSDIKKMPAFVPTLMSEYEPYRNISGDPQVVNVIKGDKGVMAYGGLDMFVTVTKADVKFNGGLVHIVDKVLTPPVAISETSKKLKLDSLVDSLMDAKMVEAVDVLSKVTVFAPNDQAFEEVQDQVDAMSMGELSKTLKYHVIHGKVAYSATLKNGSMFTTAQGEKLTVRLMGDQVYVNDKQVVMADILTNNGVVHVIDGVLSPKMPEAMPNITASNSTTSSSSKSSSNIPSPNSSGSKTVVGGLCVSIVALLAAVGVMA